MTEILKITPEVKKKSPEIVEKLDPVVVRVRNSLTQLHSLKSHRMLKYWKFREEYAQRNIPKTTEDGYTNYHMNTGFALVNTKKSEMLASMPRYDFIAHDEKSKKNKRVRELFWNYVWQTSGTDAAISSIVDDALIYGCGFGLETTLDKKRKAKIPKQVDGVIQYEESLVSEYYGSKLIHIPWSQVYVNGNNIENTTEAVIITYWDRDEFLLTFGNDEKFSGVTDENIPKGKYYYVGTGSQSITLNGNPSSTDRGTNSVQNENVVSVLEYYNKYRDEYIVLANDRWINPIVGVEVNSAYNSDNEVINSSSEIQYQICPIPFPHKEIPLVQYVDHVVPDDIWGLGEFDITENSRKFKNDIRSIHIEGIKAQGGIITISPDSDYDETVMKLGMRQVARVEPESFGFFAPNINLQSLANLEIKADEDIIIESGTDFKGQLLGPNETAQRTKGRIEAAKKRISHNLKHNAFNFFARLGRLRSANFEFCYGDQPRTLPIKGLSVDDDGSIEYVQNGYGLFTMKPEYFKGKLSLIPVVDSLGGNTSNEAKQKYLESLQLLMNMNNPDGTPTFDRRLLVEAGRGIIDEVIDLDKVLGKSTDTKTPDEIMKESGIGDTSQVPTETPSGGIPPAQQSGRPVLLGSSASEY